MASNPYPDPRRGQWLMKYRPDPLGKWVRVSLGKDPRLKGARPPKVPPQSVIDRHREFVEVEYNARHGIKAAPTRAKGLSGYLSAYVDAFAATHKAGSVRQLRRHVATFGRFAEARGVASVQAVTRALCRDYLEMRAAAVAHDTLRTELGYLSPIWSRAVEDGLMAVSPWAKLRPPGKSTRSAPVFWSSEEIARIAAACAKSWQTDLVSVLANTGLRISTALAMRWDWIDWGGGMIAIPKEAAARREGVKTAYNLKFNRVARDVLQRRHFAAAKGEGLVFPNPYRGGGEVPYDSAREAIAKAIEKAGVKKGTPHDLRHSYARLLERGGANWSLIKSQLGHSSITTTQIYADATTDEDMKFLDHFGVGEPPDVTPDPDPGPSPRRP